MGIQSALFIAGLSLSLGLTMPALALDSAKLPMISGAEEKPCDEDETGTCLENPKKRFAITTPAEIGSVVQNLLQLSKDKGWRMVRVSGIKDPRYQSRNTKGFSLLWSVEKVRRVKKPGGGLQNVYYIYYWPIYGE